ncbi:hypothetical protein N7450_011640 [Penicillium hetheringtonii]|uniref:Myb-like domain-containing protein n=1 Tax=Penicillium hetheringtonii TaxID=911720 RepID=A0AAD6DAA1_9EURO|nr:hypothetical protein N7450_011640 [Penicillium hetheringtonii]
MVLETTLLEYKDNPTLTWKNVRQMVMRYGNIDHLMGMKRRTLVRMVIYESYFLLGRSNRIATVLQNAQSEQDTLPEAPVSNMLAADNYLDHPDYPEEVSLSPYSPASSSSPSVTGLDGPGTSRIFDVFRDDPTEQEHEHVHARPSARGRTRALEEPSSPRKRHQARNTIAAGTNMSSRRRGYLKDEVPSLDEKHHPHKLTSIQDSIQYLKHFYNLASAEAKFSDDSMNGGIRDENLAVVGSTIKCLQHSYGIVATSNMSIDGIDAPASAIERHLGRWSRQDERHLLELRDSRKLSWSQISAYFPGRSKGAIQQHHSLMRFRTSERSSSKENDPKSSRYQPHSSSNIRKSRRLTRLRQDRDKDSNMERSQRYSTRSVTDSLRKNTARSSVIDPRLFTDVKA